MKNILLVDDNSDIHLMIRHVLAKAGYKVESAYCGDEGLKKMKSKTPDLVILDFMMPRKNGEQVFYEILNNPQYKKLQQIPIVMLTAKYTDNDKIKQLLEKGLAAFLFKPFGQRELLNVIENILATHEIQIQKQNLFDAIKESKDFLTKLVHNIPDALFIINRNGMISFYNGGHKEVLGYNYAEIVNQKFTKFIGQTCSVDLFIDSIEHQQKIDNFEIELISRSGKRVPFQMSAAPLQDENKKGIGMIIIGSDISEIKRLEAELIEKEKLATLTETAIAVNHEINNPLSPILGNIQLLLNERNKFNKEELQRLEAIQRNANRIMEITKKLRKIKKPIRKSYMGDTQMLDIHESE